VYRLGSSLIAICGQHKSTQQYYTKNRFRHDIQ